jgi:hypothetical protein
MMDRGQFLGVMRESPLGGVMRSGQRSGGRGAAQQRFLAGGLSLLPGLANEPRVVSRITFNMDFGFMVGVKANCDGIPFPGTIKDRHLRLRLNPEGLLASRTYFQDVLPVLPFHAMHVCLTEGARWFYRKHHRFSPFLRLEHALSMHARPVNY